MILFFYHYYYFLFIFFFLWIIYLCVFSFCVCFPLYVYQVYVSSSAFRLRLMICFNRLINFVIRITYFSKLKLFGHFIFIGIVAKAVEGFSFDCRKYFGTNLARGHRFDVHILPKARTQKAKRKTN